MNNSSARPLVGVVELPDLAERLSALGVETVTGPTLRDAAAALKAATAQHGPIPVVVADVSSPGLKAWVKMIAKTMPCVVVRSGAPVIDPGVAPEVQLPATIDQILAAVGAGPVSGGHEAYPASAQPAEPSPVFSLPDFPEDGFDERAPQGFAAAPAPAEEPWQVPAPAPSFAAPEPAFEAAAPATARYADMPWNRPAPASVPTWEAPAPQQQAPSWEPPAQQDPSLPAWEAPAQQQQAPSWEPPAPAPADAPAWDAPVLQGAPAWGTPAPAPAPSWESAPAPQQPAPRAEPREAPSWEAPSWEAPAVQPPAAAPAWSSAAADIFDAPAVTARTSGNLAQLLVVFSGKGGVGKSTLAEMLATKAAEAGLKTVLVDGNAGQGDLRTMLRLHRTDLPTVYDASISGDPRKAWLTPDLINEHRTPQMGKVPFAFVAAAPSELFGQRTVTPEVYARIIDFARRQADLVIVDTQIMEAADQFGLFDRVLRPALRRDAWGLAIADASNSGVNNLVHGLVDLEQDGVSRTRLMAMLNRIPAEHMGNLVNAPQYFNERADYIGTVADDSCVKEAANQGLLHNEHDELNEVVRKALHKVTGNAAFATRTAPAEEPGTAKPGLLGRLFGGRKAA